MGITERRRGNGVRYTAQIRRKVAGKVILSISQTFDRRKAAERWLRQKEEAIDKPGGIERALAVRHTIGDAIDRVLAESVDDSTSGLRTLRRIRTMPISELVCSEITTADIVTFAQSLPVAPSTRLNYLANLSSLFSLAGPAWGFNLNPKTVRDAKTVCRRLGVASSSIKRDRRPTLAELDTILTHYEAVQHSFYHKPNMLKIILFAIFSARRASEITRIKWADLDEEHNRVLVRDMKHPGQKRGNNKWVDLPPEAMQIIRTMGRSTTCIFPWSPATVTSSFSKFTISRGIDLNFHDLRHEGVSRLFELGMGIPQVAAVSGHVTWLSLQRYTHIRQTGDKYAGWKWLAATALQ